MTTVPFTQCCSLLAIDAKTLRQWLKQSGISLQTHPTDGRIKSLTLEQVQQLATLHDRCITPQVNPIHDALNAPVQLLEPEATASREQEADFVTKLSSLEMTVAALQQQVTQLALALLHERDQRYEQRLSTLEALVKPLTGSSAAQQRVLLPTMQDPPDIPSSTTPSPHPGERRHSRVIPLVQYSAQGTYVVVSPEIGELSFEPDSPSWFHWLASLSSFRFVGQSGRFTAAREIRRGKPTRQWAAVRGKQGRSYKFYLGITDHVTIDCLELAASTLQSRISSR